MNRSLTTSSMPAMFRMLHPAKVIALGLLLAGCGGGDSSSGSLDGFVTAEEATFNSTTHTRVLSAPLTVVPRKTASAALPMTADSKASEKMEDRKCQRQARTSSLAGKPPKGITTRASIRSDACAIDSADGASAG